MEVQLDNLIEKIKKDGVEEAKKNSQEIVDAARKQAQEIVDESKKQAEAIVKAAQIQAEQFQKNSRIALNQAARDTVLAVRQQLKGIFDKLLKRRVAEALSADFLRELLVKVIDKWSLDKDAAWEVLVNETDKDKLQQCLLGELKHAVKESIVIKINNNISKGFRIGIQGDDAYYDFSEESIVESLKELISPGIAHLLGQQDG